MSFDNRFSQILLGFHSNACYPVASDAEVNAAVKQLKEIQSKDTERLVFVIDKGVTFSYNSPGYKRYTICYGIMRLVAQSDESYIDAIDIAIADTKARIAEANNGR